MSLIEHDLDTEDWITEGLERLENYLASHALFVDWLAAKGES